MMGAPAFVTEALQRVYAGLMVARRGDPVEDTLARMLASLAAGVGAMPDRLGLSELDYRCMLEHHFPGFAAAGLAGRSGPPDAARGDEMADLRRLLMENRSGRSDAERWMVDILVAGCLGSDHLWQDLGLWCRADLSKLMVDNFAPLAERNDKDMKWKKFLYKQLCETEGIYTCRAPSCEVCADYNLCFGPEE